MAARLSKVRTRKIIRGFDMIEWNYPPGVHPAPIREAYPDPTPEMLTDPLFDAIWNAIKDWDISRHNDGIYSGPSGNDARRIYDAVRRLPEVRTCK
jgi:hypothetical protein